MQNPYDYIENIKKRMTSEDERFYSGIFAPAEVAVPDEDSKDNLCVMPDGEIRCYGVYEKKSVFDTDAQRVYLSSNDGGLSWKRRFCPEKAIGRSVYIPYMDRYVSVKDECEGSFLLIGKTPDDESPERRLIYPRGCGEIRMIFPMRSRDRVIIVGHENRPELHPTAYFAVLYYADGDLEDWTRLPLPASPFYQPEIPGKAVRWQQNNRENTIEELSDGTLMMISRTATDHHYISYSYDGGESWSDAEPSVFHSTGTMPALKRLSDGRLLFFWCNTRPLRELDDADGIWEDVFTNRDAIHVAISEDDGKTWIGFRELALNPHRNAADFRSLGGPEEGRDKSVHQVEALELPNGKVLVSYGQHYVCRRLVIFDIGWLYEKDRSENFIHGLSAVSVHGYTKSILGCYRGKPETALENVGHCAYNRFPSSILVPDKFREGREALFIREINDELSVYRHGGAVWNFPAMKNGEVTVKLHTFGEGARVSLMEFWANPCDEEVKDIACFTYIATPLINSENGYTELTLRFDCEKMSVDISANGEHIKCEEMASNAPCGLSYLHLQSMAEGEAFVSYFEAKAIK